MTTPVPCIQNLSHGPYSLLFKPLMDGPIMTTLAQTFATTDPKQFRSNLREVQNHFSGETMIPIEWILLAMGIVLIAISGFGISRWWQARHLRPSPLLAYYQVGTNLGLTMQHLWICYRIARSARLPTPLTLLMSPNTLHQYAQKYVDHMTPLRASLIYRQVNQIAAIVFQPSITTSSSNRQGLERPASIPANPTSGQ